jgi:type IV pilus assembly protein PilE
MRFRRAFGSRRGFTLIELMIVVVVVGILAAIAIPKFGRVTNAAKEAEAEPILKQIFTLQERNKQKYDVFAAEFADLEGSADPVAAARYYDFRLSGSVEEFTACARPKPDFDQLGSFQINELREVTRLASAADCDGNAP